jgi:Holliday junction resolvase
VKSGDYDIIFKIKEILRSKPLVHLVYCDNTGKRGERELDKILAGTKTMVVRGAAGRKIPHSRVIEGETLYFMEKGTAKISAKATVKSVQNFVKLTDVETAEILEENQAKLNLTTKEKQRWHKKCLCLVEFVDVEQVSPLDFNHQSNMDDWLIIEKIEDVTVGTSISYHYAKSRF